MIEAIKKNKVVYPLARSVYANCSYFLNKGVLWRNLELKDKFRGERCFVVGNGPSIGRMDLAKLKNEHAFFCNYFYLHKQIDEIKPEFYSFIEPIAANASFREKAFPQTMEKVDGFASKNPDTTLLFNIQYKKYIEKNRLCVQNKIYYFVFNGGISAKMNLEMSKPNPAGRASIYFMLAMARYLGFGEIYIIGCDSDYIVAGDGYERHFYGDNLTLQKRRPNMESAIMLYQDLKTLDIMNEYVKKDGVRIFNAGIGGMIDLFPRVDYNSLF